MLLLLCRGRVIRISTLQLANDAGEPISEMLLARRDVEEERLDLIDERVEDVKVAEGQGGVADDEEDMVDEIESHVWSHLEEFREDEAAVLQDFWEPFLRVGLGAYGRAVQEQLAEPLAEF